MSEEELSYLEKAVDDLPDEAKIVEWGSGGSTTMFLERLKPKQILLSLEHNPIWFSKVCDALRTHPNKEQLFYYWISFTLTLEKDGEVTKLNHEYWPYGDPPEENPAFLYQYIDPSHDDPTINVYDADLYFVDGIARGPILSKILLKAKNRKAPVYIHDYVGRETWYEWIVCEFSKKEILGNTLCKLTM